MPDDEVVCVDVTGNVDVKLVVTVLPRLLVVCVTTRVSLVDVDTSVFTVFVPASLRSVAAADSRAAMLLLK